MIGRWQFHAMRIPGRVWLDRDLPLQGVSCGPTLSGPYALKATLSPEYRSLIADDGDLVLRERATLIIAERDNRIHGAAILTTAQVTGSVLEIEAAGITTHGAQPYEGTKTWGGKTNGTSGHGVEALAVVRQMWSWLQAQPDADLGVTISGAATPYYMGTWHNVLKPKTPAEIEAEKKAAAKASKTKAATKAKPKPKPVEVQDPIEFAGVWDTTSKRPTPAPTKTLYWQHRISWTDKAEITARMEELATAVPFDFIETARWADTDKSDVVLGIRTGHPRLGNSLDLSFVEGENIIVPTPIRRGRDAYANAVTVYGSGDGDAQKRASASVRDGRLRNATTVEATSITSTATLKARAKAALARSKRTTDISTVVASDHPSAPIGSYGVGDDILVRLGPDSWMPNTSMRVRVTAIDIDPATDTATLSVARSDGWDYSGAGVML